MVEVSKELNVMELISLGVTGILVPLVTWVVRNGTQLLKRVTLVEERQKERSREVEELITAGRLSDKRLTRVEDAIVEMRASAQKVDESFALIMVELKQLPRLTAMVETFAEGMRQIVPRSEVEFRMRAAEDRIRLVESDIRTTGRS